MDNTYNVIHMDRRSRNVCIICTEGLEEALEEVALNADTNGMIALTEYEQCFLEGKANGMCPECLESQQHADYIIDQGLDEVDHGPLDIANGGELYPEELNCATCACENAQQPCEACSNRRAL